MADDADHFAGAIAYPPVPEAGEREVPRLARERVSRWHAPSRPRARQTDPGPLQGKLALAVIVVLTLLIVADAAAGPSVLVSRSLYTFPDWEAGPLHYITRRVILDPHTLDAVFSGLLAAMVVAYLVVLRAVRSLSMRTIVGIVIALHAILLLSPPLELTDVFNYLGYSRLGAIHHLNPYAYGINHESFDPIYLFTSWHNLRSPYGELFTALSYLLAPLPLAVSYWLLKSVTVILSLATIALVAVCARRLGRDPRYAVAFVALNPIFLIYAVGGFHNDFFMLVPSMGAIALVLSGRDRSAGASLAVAVAAKFTAILLGPFLLVLVAQRVRCVRLIGGAALAAVPLIAGSLLLFGISLPNLAQQSTLLTDSSIPNLVTWLTGLGGASPVVLKVAEGSVVLVVLWQLQRRRSWLLGAGWSTFALILSMSWLVPWYVVWLLPLAALATSVALRRATLVLTIFLLLVFAPVTPGFLSQHGINPLGTSAGRASKQLQNHLAG